MDVKSNARCRKEFIPELSRAFRENDLVLSCGAGVSKSVGLPLWDDLLERLRYRALKDDGIDISEVLAKQKTPLSPAEALKPPSPDQASVTAAITTAKSIPVLESIGVVAKRQALIAGTGCRSARVSSSKWRSTDRERKADDGLTTGAPLSR